MSCKELEAFEERITRLEEICGLKAGQTVFETGLLLPEACIDGLHFNGTRVHAVFEKQDDGWYHSRDILFLSARDAIDDRGRDVLTEYLNTIDFIESIWSKMPVSLFGKYVDRADITVSLPKKSGGIKKYNGVDCGYWLAPPFSDGSDKFSAANSDGAETYSYAHSVSGVAPVFYVRGWE
jgi:hypothetical protein